MSFQLDNLRAAYSELLTRVQTALRTQIGDAARLGLVRAEALQLAAAAEQVRLRSAYSIAFTASP